MISIKGLKSRDEFMGLLRVFSIHGRLTFPLLVAGLAALSLGVWWSVKSTVEADIRSRLSSEADLIESTFRDRMGTFANSLIHIRGNFIVDGVPDRMKFNSFVSTLELPKRFPGVRGIGYVPFVPAEDTRLNGGLGFTAKIDLLEPQDWRNRQAIGFDVLSEPARRSAVLDAVKRGEPTMTEPVTLLNEKSDKDQAVGFVLYLPLYDGSVRTENSQLLEGTIGAIYASFRATELFEGAFGTPSLEREAINFRLDLASAAKGEKLLYNRFGLAESQRDTWMSLERTIQIYGREFRLFVSPLSHFYTWSDRYLPAVVGFGAAFISILILLVLKATQNQLAYETAAKELSVVAMEKSRMQTELCKRLNDFSRTITSELDLEILIGKLLERVSDLAHADASFFYFATGSGHEITLGLQSVRGLDEARLKRKTVSLQEAMGLMPNRSIVHRGEIGSEQLLKSLISGETAFSDWMLIGIPSRELGRCGLVMLARTDGTRFEEMEVEIIESFVSQAASAIENARLYRRTEEASRAKNAFLANMSHEIRTPLNAIVGFSEILLKEGMTNVQRGHLAQNIRKGSQQLTRIIDDILDLSRVEAGKLSIESKRFRLSTLLHEIKSVMDMRASEKRIELSIESSGPLPSHIVTDEVRLKQIIMNVIGNAIKFTEKGAVLLHVRYVQSEQLENFIAFRVRDTGIGISDDAQKRIFEPFSQGDDSKTRRFGGSGLGLVLSKRLCNELGGDLQLIESIPGKGSTFEAKVNVGDLTGVEWERDLFESLPEEQKPMRPIVMGRLSGTKLLLVEDSVDNQEIFKFFLESAGAEVDIVDNGLDAVRKADGGDYDMILMDIQIPEIDGKEATRRIRNLGFEPPIVALTAHAMSEERRSCIEAGCDGQITKPVSGENLVIEVAEYLRRTNAGHPQHFGRDAATVLGAAQV